LAWLDRLLELEMLRLRAQYELSLDELRGLYISDRQVDELLGRNTASSADIGPVDYLSAEAKKLYRLRPTDTPLHTLARRFGLTAVERDLLLVAVAPDIALKYETLYAYLNNDITRKYVTVDLAVRLLRSETEEVEVRSCLRPGGTLFATGLLEWMDAG